jgi:hypothetical protein
VQEGVQAASSILRVLTGGGDGDRRCGVSTAAIRRLKGSSERIVSRLRLQGSCCPRLRLMHSWVSTPARRVCPWPQCLGHLSRDPGLGSRLRIRASKPWTSKCRPERSGKYPGGEIDLKPMAARRGLPPRLPSRSTGSSTHQGLGGFATLPLQLREDPSVALTVLDVSHGTNSSTDLAAPPRTASPNDEWKPARAVHTHALRFTVLSVIPAKLLGQYPYAPHPRLAAAAHRETGQAHV